MVKFQATNYHHLRPSVELFQSSMRQSSNLHRDWRRQFWEKKNLFSIQWSFIRENQWIFISFGFLFFFKFTSTVYLAYFDFLLLSSVLFLFGGCSQCIKHHTELSSGYQNTQPNSSTFKITCILEDKTNIWKPLIAHGCQISKQYLTAPLYVYCLGLCCWLWCRLVKVQASSFQSPKCQCPLALDLQQQTRLTI